MKEIWKDIKGYEGLYQVSNLGNVKGIRRRGSCGGILKPDIKEFSGYLRVTLCKNNKTKRFQIHRLVLEAFVGPRPSDNHFGMHKDNNTGNNIYTNLSWGTPQENSDHRTASGNNVSYNLPRGSKHYASKIKEDDIKIIFELHNSGISNKNIALKFNVNPSQIGRILNNLSWKHVKRTEV